MKQKTLRTDTLMTYDELFASARTLFLKKNKDYGSSWTILRPSSLTDQIYIKAARIRSLEEKQQQMVEDDISDDYIGLINYCIMALIQLKRSDFEELNDTAELIARYDAERDEVRSLMLKKNHDYGEAWRNMRISSMTDLILMKLLRIRAIEDGDEGPEVSEDVDAGFRDIINYAIFAQILLKEQREQTS